tara:strand:- start:647 stop:1099 length:453 start_codon:yes stop_codon:yes gene_type:complete
MAARTYTTRRKMIVASIVTKLKTINGLGSFLTDLANNVEPRLKFWDEVDDFPAIHCNAGTETREYHGGGVKTRFLTVTLRCYVKAEDSTDALDRLIEDVETVIEGNSRLSYVDNQGALQFTQDITVRSIETDEGVLEPLGVGEILLEVRY